MTRLAPLALLTLALLGVPAAAHDPWVQANAAVVRAGDGVHVDLMLGNHGNDHRDFKLAGKVGLEHATLTVVAPDGARHDLKPRLDDLGYAPKEGFRSARYTTAKPGLYLVAHTLDQVASYAPVRNVKSAKTCFVASKSLDRVPVENPGFDRVLGHPLELVPVGNPVTPMGPDTPIRVRLLFRGKPLAGARISFVPRGTALQEGFDPRYERRSDGKGEASFRPAEGNYYLVVAHHHDAAAAGPGYKGIKYSATLVVLVPQTCPCCGD